VSQGGGTLSDTTTVTDVAGEARTTWTLPSQTGMHTASANVAGLAGVDFTTQTEADTNLPTFVRWTVSPGTVTVSDGAATISFTVTAADVGSGVAFILIRLDSPTGAQTTGCTVLRQVGVIPTEVTWSCTSTLPRYAEPGVWLVNGITLQDRIRNETRVSRAQLQQLGQPTSLVVQNATPDVRPPELNALSFTPQVLDVTNASGTLQVTAGIADALSGVKQAQLAISAQGGTPSAECLEMTRVAGSEAAGTWTCPVSIPQSVAPGTWRLVRFSVWDNAGNLNSYGYDQLRAAGFPADITIVSASPDTVAPELIGFSVMPQTVNVSQGDQRVEFTITARDAGRGVVRVYAFLAAPGASSAGGCTATTPVTGTAAEGTFKCGMNVSQFGVAGEWVVKDLRIVDGAGNTRTYQRSDLEAAGFRATVTVVR
jgi:hypothetical protein